MFGFLSKNAKLGASFKDVVHSESISTHCQYSVAQTNTTKFLGDFNDQHLSWKTHIHHITTKLSKAIGIITKHPENTLFFFDLANIYYGNLNLSN